MTTQQTDAEKRIAELETAVMGEDKVLTDIGENYAFLIDQLRAAQAKNEELEQLFALHYKREVEAIKRWRAEDPTGRALRAPAYGALLDWLYVELEMATAKSNERREMLEEVEWIKAGGYEHCLICLNSKDEGHDTRCYIAKAIGEDS